MKNFLQALWIGVLAGCAGGSDLPGTLTVTPTEVALGDVPVDTTADATFTIRNDGDEPLEVYSTSLEAGDPDVWEISTDGGPTLEAGDDMTLIVTFAPEDEGNERAIVAVRSSDESTGTVTLTIDAVGSPSTVDSDEDGYAPADGDCNDGRDDVHPGAPELCDGLDNDCNEQTPANESDEDSDGFRICENDCDPADGDVYPGAPEICDQKDSDCSGNGNRDDEDDDGDGVSVCEGDCDDGEELAYPGLAEACDDGIDNDCSGGIDDIDADSDGHSLCHPAGDCNDDDDTAYPVIVDAAAPTGGNGTEEAPFRGLNGAFGGLDATCRTIWMAAGAYTPSRTVTAGPNVTIVGEDAATVVLTPPLASRAFVVEAGASLTLQSLTLSGADVTGDGGAVSLTGGTVVLEGVIVRDNTCGGDGGGMAVAGGGTLTIIDSLFQGNEAGDDGGALALASGTLTIDGTDFLANSGVRGGAVFDNGGALSVDDAMFDGNIASQDGGALYLEGGSTTVDVLRSVFWRNTASGIGGALAARNVVDATGGVRNNRFQNNTATGDGGGVALAGTATGLVLANNTFTVNTSGDDGAHVYVDATDASALQCVANIGGWGNAAIGKPGFFVADTDAVATDNLVFGTSGPDFGGALVVDTFGNLSSNPLFVAFTDDANPANDDLALQTTPSPSPGIDSGPIDAAWNDLDASRNDRGFEGGPLAAP